MNASARLRSLAGDSLTRRGITAIELVSLNRGTVLCIAEIVQACEAMHEGCIVCGYKPGAGHASSCALIALENRVRL